MELRPARLLPALAAACLLVACVGSRGASPGSSDASGTPTERPSFRPATGRPTPTPEPVSGGEMTITGSLGADSIEGGCVYLQVDDGTRYEILWPDGWQLDAQGRLVDPAGEIVAELGDELSVRGGIADGMASICQVGPIFRATEVTSAGG